MNDNFKKFIETLEAPNTIKVVNSLKAIGQYDYANCTVDKLNEIILSMKPNSIRSITTICYVLGAYAKFLKDDKLYDMIQNVDRNKLWYEAKPIASKKFISNYKFKEVYHDIGVYEEFNSFYYQMLFRCLYEGIYNDDMSVVKNLRASDIHNNIITLKEDNGNSYDMEVSEEFAINLKELSQINTWERKNRYGVFQMQISGIHPDSCFKVESRKDASEYSYRYTYYRILRKIAKEYLEYNLLPLQLYVSGIMYRIGLKLQDYNIDMKDAFADQNRDRIVSKIISNELLRCNCNTEVRNFREMVKGHLDIFMDYGNN